MTVSTSDRCRTCITTLNTIITALSNPDRQNGQIHHDQVDDELTRFSLWMGNIGALHRPESAMSLESRLREADEVLIHIQELLENLNEVTGEILAIVSGQRKGENASDPYSDCGEEQDEATELLEELAACITRLFRVSSLIREAAPTDLFAKALSRKRYRFNDQFDIAHVGEKYPKLATDQFSWLRKRLGQAITRRRHYLSYIQDHRQKLGDISGDKETAVHVAPRSQAPTEHPATMNPLPDTSSRPSTFLTQASSLMPGHNMIHMLTVEEDSDPEHDARSYTTISRSTDGDIDSSAIDRIPRLDELRTGTNKEKEFECPFCFRVKKFKNEKAWRRHVFSDLRSYICTFPGCDAPYFSDINEWFRHEMQSHRVDYTCRLCRSRTFQLGAQYLDHVRKKHPDILEDGNEESVLSIARKPVDQILVRECPCCSEWVDRLQDRGALNNTSSDASSNVLGVVPTVFKRHLASHLEQLALFAIPIVSADEGEVISNAAIDEDVGALSRVIDHSTLAFDSPRPASPMSEVQSPDEIQIAEKPALDAVNNLGDFRAVLALPALARDEYLRHVKLRKNDELRLQYLWALDSNIIRGESHYDRGELAEAEAIYSRVLQGYEETLGSEHESTLDTAFLLGNVYLKQNKMVEAEAMYSRALQAHEEGAVRCDAAFYLGKIYSKQGKLAEAEAMYSRALQGYEKTLEPKRSSILDTARELGNIYSEQGKLDEAEQMLARAREGMEETFGAKHPSTLDAINDLHNVYVKQGKVPEP